MRADPKPDQMLTHVESQGAMIKPDTGGVNVGGYLLELQRGMARIVFEKLKILISQRLHLVRQMAVMKPKIWMGLVLHRSVHFPAS